jgi:hypothetical protein
MGTTVFAFSLFPGMKKVMRIYTHFKVKSTESYFFTCIDKTVQNQWCIQFHLRKNTVSVYTAGWWPDCICD